MVTPYLPYPPASGGQIRTLNLLKYLSKKNQITLVALYKTAEEKKYLSYLKPFCKEIYLCKRPEKPWRINIILKAVFSRKPFLIVRNFSAEAKKVIEKLLEGESFDVIHCETFYVMPHIPPTSIPVLLVEQTIEFEVYQHFVDNLPFLLRGFFYFDILKLKHWERYYWKNASTVATVSLSDRELIKKNEKKISPVIISNGAGDEMFVKSLPEKTLDKPILLFIGNFFWLQNKEAANYLVNKIYPLLKESLKNFSLIVAGQEASRVNFELDKNITVIDIKPDDNDKVKQLYQKATLFIAPIYGPGGTRLKILASMAAGLPVIGTKTGFEGLDVQDNSEVLVANDPPEFVNKIKLVLQNQKLYRKLQENSYIKVRKIYSWDSISKRLENVYKTIQHK